MAKPLVSVIGRPNVGKSTFFNRMAGRRIAIVDDQPGVTRDRLYADVNWLNYNFTMIDTAGIDPLSDDEMLQNMRAQAELAVELSQVILFFVDAKDGMTSMDAYVGEILRKSGKPVILVLNKADSPDDPDTLHDFYELGFGMPIAISAAHGLGIGDLLDEVVSHFNPNGDEEETKAIKIAVVGKPNAGKSSLVNRILNYERSIVSNISGTTRDAIDTPFKRNGKDYVIIDTAGIRKKSKIDGGTVERYAVVRSFDAVRRSDVVLITIDATEGLTDQDVKIAGYAHDEGRAVIIVVNKWDLVEKDTYTVNQFKKDIQSKLVFMTYAPIMYVSALTGQRLSKIIDYVDNVFECANRRIPTGLLNDCLGEATAVSEPPSKNGRRLKIYYATQVAVAPPTFVLFVNDPELVHFSYMRYLENYFRKSFDFTGTPIRILTRYKNEKEME